MKAEALHWAAHHPEPTLIVLVIAAALIWIGWRKMTAAVQIPEGGWVQPGIGWLSSVVVMFAGVALVIWLGNYHPAGVKVINHPPPKPRVIVQHVTRNITEHVPAGDGGWVVLAVIVVAVLAFVAFINWLVRR